MLSYHLRQEYEEELANLGTSGLYNAHKEHNEYYTLQKMQSLDLRIKERMAELEESWTRCRRLVKLKASIHDAEKREGNERLALRRKREQRSKRMNQHRRWRNIQVKKKVTVTVCAGQSSSHVKEAMDRPVKTSTASRVHKLEKIWRRKNKQVEKEIIVSLAKASNHTPQSLFMASKAQQNIYKRFEQYKRWTKTKSQIQDGDSVKIVVDNSPSDSDSACGISGMSAQAPQEKMLRPIPRFTIVSKSLHSALNWPEDTVDRLTDKYNQNRLMSRGQYENLCSSIEKIHKYMQETITSDNNNDSDSKQDILDGLDKLFNGGHISNYQQKTYIARYKLASG
jgi:predicted PP-loop superfamily ATPase